jgi:hypothetical protein
MSMACEPLYLLCDRVRQNQYFLDADHAKISIVQPRVGAFTAHKLLRLCLEITTQLLGEAMD